MFKQQITMCKTAKVFFPMVLAWFSSGKTGYMLLSGWLCSFLAALKQAPAAHANHAQQPALAASAAPKTPDATLFSAAAQLKEMTHRNLGAVQLAATSAATDVALARVSHCTIFRSGFSPPHTSQMAICCLLSLTGNMTTSFRHLPYPVIVPTLGELPVFLRRANSTW